MADEIAKLGLEIDSSDTIKATKELDRLEKQSGETERATEGVEQASKRSGKAMAAYAIAGAAITAALFKSISLHKQFGAAISDLSAITGATGKDLEFYNQQALLIGKTTTLSATQAAVAFKLIASAKPDLLESKEALASVTAEAVALAEAASIDMPEAAEALGSALNQFGAGAESASRFINVLAAGSKFGASEIADVSVALREAGTVASAAGLSFETTNAAIQSLAGVAIKGSKAGTALRNILVNLQVQSDDNINPAVVGLSTALENLGDMNLTVQEQTKLFGKEQLAAAQALIKNAKQVKDLEGKLTGTATAYEQAAIKVDNLEGDTKKLNSAWESAALMLGNVFDPALRTTTQFLTDTAKVAESIIIAFDDMGNALGAYAAAAAAALSLDFEGASRILDLREEEAAANEERLSAVWAEVDAKKALAEQNEKVTASAQVTDLGAPVDGEATDTASSMLAGGVDITAIEDSLKTKTELLIEQHENEKLLVEQWISEDFAREEEGNQILLELEANYQAERVTLAENAAKNKKGILDAEFKIAGIGIKGLTGLMSSEGKKQSATGKALAKVSIVTSTAQAVMNALAVAPYPLGVTLALKAGKEGAKQLGIVGGGGGSTPDISTAAPDTVAANLAPATQTQQVQRTTPTDVNIVIEGVVDRQAADKIADEMRELFRDGGRGLEE